MYAYLIIFLENELKELIKDFLFMFIHTWVIHENFAYIEFNIIIVYNGNWERK